MDGHDIIVIGSSAGGVEALMKLCAGFPPNMPAALFIVQHVSPTSRSVLPELLSRVGPLPARHPQNGEPIRRGTICIAPPDMHLLLRTGHVMLRRGPQENRTRPAIDPLFRSAAVAFRARVVGVVLTGLLDDGTAGLNAIKRCGGVSVVQDPSDATWPEMPRNALARDHVDHCVPLATLPDLLTRLARRKPGPNPPVPPILMAEVGIAAQEEQVMGHSSKLGHPTTLSCPQCGGVLNETIEQGTARFRCQIGHAFTAEYLATAQRDGLEQALESAVRIHRDRVALFRRMQSESEAQGLSHAAARWRAGADDSEHAAALIVQALSAIRKEPD